MKDFFAEGGGLSYASPLLRFCKIAARMESGLLKKRRKNS